MLTGFNQANPGGFVFAKTVFRFKKKTAQKGGLHPVVILNSVQDLGLAILLHSKGLFPLIFLKNLQK